MSLGFGLEGSFSVALLPSAVEASPSELCFQKWAVNTSKERFPWPILGNSVEKLSSSTYPYVKQTQTSSSRLVTCVDELCL